MSIRNMLSEIINEGAERPADQKGGEKAPEKITQDVTKQGKLGNKSALGNGRIADKSGEQADHEGTKIDDPSGKIGKGRGTEVQGNTNADDGLGESIVVAKAAASIAESIMEMADVKVDMSGIKSLCEAQNLDEDFAAKAVEIFETAVNDMVRDRLTTVAESIDEIIAGAVAEEIATIEEQVDAYLDYVVTEWAEENRLAIEQGARTEIAESFMENMKGLLESHYVELPDGKADLYESAIEQGEEIYIQLQEAEAENADLRQALSDMEKVVVVESVVGGMTSVQADKVRTLAESMSYDGDVESFSKKLTTLSEGYLKPKAKASTLVEDAGQIIEQDDVIVTHVDSDVAAALSALNRFNH